MRDSFITTAEAKKIVKDAEKGPVTLGEAQAVVSLFERGKQISPPGMMVTLAIPENPGAVTLEAGAKTVMETFFIRNNIPAGNNREFVKAQAKLTLANATLGSPLASPPNVSRHFAIHLTSADDMARDIPGKVAFVDSKKEEMFVRVNVGRTFGPGERWYGPIKLENVGWTEAVGEGPGDVVAIGGN